MMHNSVNICHCMASSFSISSDKTNHNVKNKFSQQFEMCPETGYRNTASQLKKIEQTSENNIT